MVDEAVDAVAVGVSGGEGEGGDVDDNFCFVFLVLLVLFVGDVAVVVIKAFNDLVVPAVFKF